MHAAIRAACVELLHDYAEEEGLRMTVYPSRPGTIFPPTAFVDRIRERLLYPGQLRQRIPIADIVVVHAHFDSKEATDQKDAFVDGFLNWTLSRFHAAGANTLVAVTATEDDPNWLPDWIAPKDGKQPMYYATLLQMEGFAAD